MTTLGTALHYLSNLLTSNITGVSVAFEQYSNHDDHTNYPLIEINFIKKTDTNFAASSLSEVTIQVLYHNTTTYDKYTFDAMEEKLKLDRLLREILDAWHTTISTQLAIGIGSISQIDNIFFDSLANGENGSSNTIRVGLQFSLQYKELSGVNLTLPDFTNPALTSLFDSF